MLPQRLLPFFFFLEPRPALSPFGAAGCRKVCQKVQKRVPNEVTKAGFGVFLLLLLVFACLGVPLLFPAAFFMLFVCVCVMLVSFLRVSCFPFCVCIPRRPNSNKKRRCSRKPGNGPRSGTRQSDKDARTARCCQTERKNKHAAVLGEASSINTSQIHQ